MGRTRKLEAEVLELRVKNAKMLSVLENWARAANHARTSGDAECEDGGHCPCVYVLRHDLEMLAEFEKQATKLLKQAAGGEDVADKASLLLTCRELQVEACKQDGAEPDAES